MRSFVKVILAIVAVAVAVVCFRQEWLSQDVTEAGVSTDTAAIADRGEANAMGVDDRRQNGSGQVTVLPVAVDRLRRVTQVVRDQAVSGTLVAARRTSLAFERSGRLDQVLVDEGQRVAAGESLAVLDQRQLQIQIRQTEAQLAQQQAVLAELQAGPRPETIQAAKAEVDSLTADAELRQLTFQRTEQLSQRSATAQQSLDDARFAWKIAVARRDVAVRKLEELMAGTRVEQVAAQQAAVNGLMARLDALHVDLTDSTLLAPFAGTIIRRFADEGRMLTPEQSVLELLESDHLEAHVGLPSSLVKSTSSEDYLVLTIGGRDVTGRLRQILPQVDRTTRTQTAIIDVQGSEELALADGQLVRLRVSEVVATDGFRVPMAALSAGPRGLWNLAVVVDNRIQLRAVELLVTETEFAVIRGAVREGDVFVINGAHRLIDGQLVLGLNMPEAEVPSAETEVPSAGAEVRSDQVELPPVAETALKTTVLKTTVLKAQAAVARAAVGPAVLSSLNQPGLTP